MLYNPPLFRTDDAEAIRALIAAHPLATLVSQGAGGEQGLFDVSLLPLLYEEKDGKARLIGHLARANPHWTALKAAGRAMAVFRGTDFYVSPGWYPSKQIHGKVVPTWNYELVLAEGPLEVSEEPEALRAIVTRLTRRFEGERAAAGAEPWAVTDAPADYVEAMLKAIVGVTLTVERLQGKRKMSQNRPEEDKAGVAAGLAAEPVAETPARLASLASVAKG